MNLSDAFQAVFNNWTALQLAVAHQLGGPQSREIAQWMVTTTENYFKENDNVIPEEAADYIGDMLNNEFNTLCEDGSLEEVGEKLCKYFQMIQAGRGEEVAKELATLKGSGVQSCKSQEPQQDEEESEEDTEATPMDTDATEEVPRRPKNEPDEDGWITVTKGKK